MMVYMRRQHISTCIVDYCNIVVLPIYTFVDVGGRLEFGHVKLLRDLAWMVID